MAEVVERVANLEARFDAHAHELARLHESVVRVEGTMERRFEGLESKVESGFKDIRSEMRSDFRWVMGGIAGAVLTVILAMFAKNWL